MVRVVDLGAEAEFAATVKVTVPFPVPLPPPLMVLQSALFIAVQGQPVAALTLTDEFPPPPPTAMLVALNV